MHRLPPRPLALAVAGLIAVGCDAGDAPLPGDAAALADHAPAEFAPVNQSGITGTVTADHDEEQATLTVQLAGLAAGAAYQVDVHTGRCAAGGPIVAPIGEITARSDGTGRVEGSVPAALLRDEPAFVQAQDASGAAVSCADLPGHEPEADPLTERAAPDSADAPPREGA